MTKVPVRMTVSERGGFNFVLLDPSQDTNDLCDDRHETFLDALWEAAEQRGPGTHVLTVEC